MESRTHAKRRSLLGLGVVTAVAAATVGITTTSAGASPVIMAGGAYAISSSGLIKVVPTPLTQPVPTAGASNNGSCVKTVNVGLVLQANVLCSSVTTGQLAETPPTAVATASVAGVNVALPGAGLVAVRGVSVTSGSNCQEQTGNTEIAGLRIGLRNIVSTNSIPKKNTVIALGNVRLVLNEQIPLADGLEVNAVHLTIASTVKGAPPVENLVIASATTFVTGCPAP